MLGIPRRFAHYIFGILQSGLTSALASAIASIGTEHFLAHWSRAWLLSWGVMLPIVIFAAPLIRQISNALTRE